MAVKTASVTLAGADLRFVARSGSGHVLALDDARGDAGPRPAELIPMALAGCTAMDVMSILRKKHQEVTRYEVRAEGVQMDDHPNAFTRIDVLHVVQGPAIDVEALRRAIELSATKYCSVGATLSTGITEIHHAYLLRGGDGSEQAAEVLVLGPGADLAATATEGRGVAAVAGRAAAPVPTRRQQ
jgi:putative redox protein